MTKRPVRVVLLLLFVAAMGTTAYLFWIAERESRSTEAAARAFDDHARSAEGQVADLRSAQQAYVAAGQGPDFWFAKATKALEDLRSSIADLRATASAPATVAAFDDVLGSLQDYDQMDARARVYARGHQPSLASDLIFSNGADLIRKISESIDQARLTERAARDAQIAALNRREVFSLGAAAAASLLIVLLLMPAGASREAGLTIPVESPAAVPPRPVANLGLDAEGWSPAKREKPVETNDEEVPEPAREAAAAPVTESAPVPASPAPPVPVAPRIHLPQVASICADLARIVDTRTLPSLLERAADTLDAAGIVLWVADPDGRELAPTMAYGYAPTLVVRLGTIERDAENATAAAFRTSLIQTVTADAVSNGAIAAPLVGAAGCVGVMAAEVRHRGEQDDSVLAAAGIIAAQLATLVAPPSSRTKAEAAG
jgi:hypothetical protein